MDHHTFLGVDASTLLSCATIPSAHCGWFCNFCAPNSRVLSARELVNDSTMPRRHADIERVATFIWLRHQLFMVRVCTAHRVVPEHCGGNMSSWRGVPFERGWLGRAVMDKYLRQTCFDVSTRTCSAMKRRYALMHHECHQHIEAASRESKHGSAPTSVARVTHRAVCRILRWPRPQSSCDRTTILHRHESKISGFHHRIGSIRLMQGRRMFCPL